MQEVAIEIANEMKVSQKARGDNFTVLDAMMGATMKVLYDKYSPEIYHKIIKKVNGKMTKYMLNPEVYDKMLEANVGEETELPEDYEKTHCTRKRWRSEVESVEAEEDEA